MYSGSPPRPPPRLQLLLGVFTLHLAPVSSPPFAAHLDQECDTSMCPTVMLSPRSSSSVCLAKATGAPSTVSGRVSRFKRDFHNETGTNSVYYRTYCTIVLLCPPRVHSQDTILLYSTLEGSWLTWGTLHLRLEGLVKKRDGNFSH